MQHKRTKTMARSKKVLNDTTNKKKATKTTAGKKTVTKPKPKKLKETVWRKHILAFYKCEIAQTTYCEGKYISIHPFRTRWEKSGLRDLKKRKAPYSDAVTQYDFWFHQWRCDLRDKQVKNRSKIQPAGFVIHVENADESTVDDSPTTVVTVDLTEQDFEKDDNDVVNVVDVDVPPSVEEVEKKKPRTTKLEGEKMKELLTEYYLRPDGTKLLAFIREKDRVNNKNAISRHWKDSGLEQRKFRDEPLHSALKDYDAWCAIEKQKQTETNRSNASDKKALPVELEIFIRELIKQLALSGQGIGKKAVRQILREALIDGGDTGDGKASFSRSTLNRFFNNYKLECKNVKNIDPARIAQVTPENRDAFFFRLDQVVSLIHAIDPDNCKAQCWSEVHADLIYNMDELGTDPTKFRDVLLVPAEIKNRIFQSTPEGDRPSTHLSFAMFSCSNGKYKDQSANIEGAPMPMMIHSSPDGQDGMSAIEKRLHLYEEQDTILFDEDRFNEGFTREDKNLGITVRSSPNGSMTKVLFLDAALHFIKNNPSDQGASGKYSFLLLDSHVSRWNPKALYLLFKNRIIPIFFPSHLSIVVQPQDNGVILFFHKCMEEASLISRLFKTETDISYSNRIMANALYLFREGERKKLMSRGSNSTTRSYNITGIKPRNPYSSGWRENLELYASFNSIHVKQDDGSRYYGVQPKKNDACPDFSEADISMLDEAVPNFVSEENDVTILHHAKSKCYSIAEEIINSWLEKSADERTVRPRATSSVEKLALKHMDIANIISAQPKSDESMLLEVNFEKRKREAMLYLTKSCEQIQVKPKENNSNNNNTKKNRWYYAERMELSTGMWNIFDGQTSKQLTTDEIDQYWDVNIEYNMFPDDKKLQENNYRSGRRRRNEKNQLLKRMAKALAEEERNADLKESFDAFMEQQKEKQTFIDFKLALAARIERPSNHTVTVQLGKEEHIIKVVAHGNNTSSMSQLVMDNVCRVMIGNTNRTEKKKNKKRRGGRVNRVKRGSDGFVKSLQIDQQHIRDLSSQEEIAEKKKKNDVVLCKRRLKLIQTFQSMEAYGSIWNDDSTVDLQKVKQKHLKHLLKIFNVTGRAKLNTNGPIRAVLTELAITQASIHVLKSKLLLQLEEYGEEYDPDDGALDSSFAGGSIADTSIVIGNSPDDSLVNDDAITSLNIDDDETSGGDNNFVALECETSSGGDAGSIGSGNKTDDTAELNNLIECAQRKKTVSFNKITSIQTFSQQDGTSTSSSSSSEDEIFRRQPRSRNRRQTRKGTRRSARNNKRASATLEEENIPPSPPSPPLPPPLPPPASQLVSEPVVLRRSFRCANKN